MSEALEELAIVALDAHGRRRRRERRHRSRRPARRACARQADGQARGARRDAERRARARRADVPLVRPMRRLRRTAHVGFALSRMEARSRRRGAEARGRCGRGRRAYRRAWRGAAPRDLSRPISPCRARRGRLHARAVARHHIDRRLSAVRPRHDRRDSSGARAERRSERLDEAARHCRDRHARAGSTSICAGPGRSSAPRRRSSRARRMRSISRASPITARQ